MIKEPLGYDAKGRPVWAVDDSGRPICGASRSRGPCRSRARMENGRCRMCGGASLSGPSHPSYKHGLYSRETLRRDLLLSRLASFCPSDSATDLLSRAVEVLRQNVDEGNFTAAKYIFDQLAGQPRTTMVYEIANADLLEAVASVTAEFIGPERYEEWWGRVRGALEASG